MLIRKLILHNIRSYADAEIEFPEGSVLLSGDIGSGKTTILQAIDFALFGTDNEKLSGTALLRKGATEAYVELCIDIEGQPVTIHRKLRFLRGAIAQTAGYISVNGTRKDATPVELKSEIISLLGYPQDLVSKKKNLIYRYSVYCPQDEMKHILADDRDTRLDTLRKIFGIDKYKFIRENSAIIIRELRQHLRDNEFVAEGIEQLRQGKIEKDNYLSDLSVKISGLVSTLSTLRSDITLQKVELEAIKKKHMEALELKKQLAVFQSKENMLEEMLRRENALIAQLSLKAMAYAKGEIEALEKEISSKHEEISSKSNEKNLICHKLEDLKKRIASLSSGINNGLPDNMQKQENLLRELQIEIETKTSIINRTELLESKLRLLESELHEQQSRLKASEETASGILQYAVCPSCRQTVPKEHKDKIRREEGEKVILCRGKIDKITGDMLAVKSDLKKLRNKLSYIAELEKKQAECSAVIRQMRVQMEHNDLNRKELNDVKNIEQQLNAQLSKYANFSKEEEFSKLRQLAIRLDELKAAEKAYADMQQSLLRKAEIEVQLSRISEEKIKLAAEIKEDIELRLQKLSSELDTLARHERDMSISYEKLSTEKVSVESGIKQLIQQLELKENARQRVENYKKLIHWMDEYFSNLMSTIEKHVMMRIYGEFNDLFRVWFAVLIPDENMLARLDDTFTPVVEHNGHEVDVSFLSGGERTSVALAYRLSLNKVLTVTIQNIKSSNLLILDEPTEGFSTDQLDKVRDVLQELKARQVIIVSHETKIESFVDKVIKITKESGLSRIAS